ncbi:hypothetical protein QJV03_09915 [Listeria swaminathanii]|uniref:Uncharacterized protein n=1 Tax=Listeria swaminathanii TaxID=2713501 RepID=A0ABU2IFM0_9LIST|nr:hypothetical protein [Listeria swaminathanii]MDT0017496.1 hypothetical protein [Listeria swaminathanii]MDT0022585.1 hypothetical protein [Listeria swaminathanii]MDT0033549.1 hypothetical protein [Listeria swaminathanii]MDT0052499.1 hypothetical protein [Listeria swaminathanii]MDT0055264.1 hypothetical protein [Listeria swaminathanii]
MPSKWRGICASLLIALGVTQLYSFTSAVIGYFTAEENSFVFVWNYWMLLLFGLGLFIVGFIFMRKENFRVISIVLVACFVLFQGFSVYYYQLRILAKLEYAQPFEWSGTLLCIAGVLVLIALLVGPKFQAKEVTTDQAWKTKWRYAAGLFSLLGAVTSIYAAVTIFKQLHSDNIKEGYLFTTSLDGYFACFMAVVFLLVAVLAWRKVSYLLIGILMGAAFILLTNYLSVTSWIDFAKENLAITFGSNERKVFGMQFLMGASAFISSIFAYIAKK